MTSFLHDVRYSGRQIRKNPGFAIAAVLTLALGIGATVAMFSLVDRVLFRSLPYPHDKELVSVGVMAPIIDGEFLFASNYLGWRQHQTAFANFASSTGVSDCDLTENNPIRLACAAVSSSFLPTFSIQPVLGRNFTCQEDEPNAPQVALISYSLWKNRFGGNRGAVGSTIQIDGQPTRIIGVLPSDFEYPTLAHTDVVLPQALDEAMVQRHEMGPVVRVFGRMKPGATVEQTKAELQPLFDDFVQSAPPPFRQVLKLQVRSIRDLQVHDSRRAAWLLLLSALVVLAIACSNAANLVLARSVGRRRELAVRSALGAGRARLFQQRLTEAFLLATLGGAAGVALATLIIRTFVTLAPAGIPRLCEASIDPRILFFAMLVSLASAVFFGTLPALEKPGQMLTVNAMVGVRKERIRQLLLIAQVSMAVVLLASAFLFVRSLRNLETQSLGIETQNLVTAQITLGQQKYSSAQERLAFFEELEHRLGSLPGMQTMALADSLPPRPPNRTMPFVAMQAQGEPPLAASEGIGGVVGWRSVTPNYFSALGIPVLRGRPFEEQDRAPEAHTIILNQALARRLFPNEEALGKAVQFRTDRTSLTEPFTVIGVAANTQNQGLGGDLGPEYYMVRRHDKNDVIFDYPDSQHISMIVRSPMKAETVAQEIKSAVAELDPTLPIDASTMGQTVAKLAGKPRFSASLLSLFALVGVLLTALGTYGVVSLLVNQRTQEIGVRMALGATYENVIQMMVWQASRWIAVGALAGIFASVLAAHWIGSLLFGIQANDPTTLIAAAASLVLVAVIAAWIPARHTARIDPVVALRYE